MTGKELLLRAIHHEETPRLPLMYRAHPTVSRMLARYFGLADPEQDWEALIKCLGADNYSDGETLGAFTSYVPRYIGPEVDCIQDVDHFFLWGIKPVKRVTAGMVELEFHHDPPLGGRDELGDLRRFSFPRLEWFDFESCRVVIDAPDQDLREQQVLPVTSITASDRLFHNACMVNSIFMTSIFLRGTEQMLMDLAVNQDYAEALIARIGEFCLEFCRETLARLGPRIDLYGIWDDFASQDGLMISPDAWRRFYKPWHRRLIAEAKRHGLLVSYHICGNCSAVIPDLIEMGVDILDPVQVSARDMDLGTLKRRFGRDICLHGGLDSQRLLTMGTPAEIRARVREARRLVGSDGGLILGPSHYLTNDVPLENILAIYAQD
jgi:uroporphyrinogen decarboxylase